MGKQKDKKKGKGAEKTAQKTDKKAEKKTKKQLKEKGEEDIESLLAEFQNRDKKLAEVIEEKSTPPTARCNISLCPHPEREELLLFGGEYFNGNKTFVYNDLFVYNIKNGEWTVVKAPEPPPPRCGHQAVTVAQEGGQMWVFGGEFMSPSQSQFYHYKDLWKFSLKEKRWQKVSAPGGPSSRSGHRMVACKKLLMVFGGFHDNTRDYKYFNDMHAFNLETYTWMKLEISGTPPAPRSACVLGVTQNQNQLLVYGGYSKEKLKKDVDQGKTHTDMFQLSVDSRCKQESTPAKWKWSSVKQSGCRPSPRCGCTLAPAGPNRAVLFGGVCDEEDEETVTGMFHNDMYSLELDKGKWHDVELRGKREAVRSKRRRKKKAGAEEVEGAEGGGDSGVSEGEESGDDDMEDIMDDLSVGEGGGDGPKVPQPAQGEAAMDTNAAGNGSAAVAMDTATTSSEPAPPAEDSIFTVSVGPQTGSSAGPVNLGDPEAPAAEVAPPFKPRPRMNAALAMRGGLLYMYGGLVELGDKQYTLADMYALDLHKLDEWGTLVACELKLEELEQSDEDWSDTDSDDDEEEESDENEV